MTKLLPADKLNDCGPCISTKISQTNRSINFLWMGEQMKGLNGIFKGMRALWG